MQEQIIIGGFTALGALAYNAWGFFEAWNKTLETDIKEFWDWRLTVSTIIPSLVAGFIAGYQMTPSSAADFVGLVIAGFGVAAAQGKLGIKSFFRTK